MARVAGNDTVSDVLSAPGDLVRMRKEFFRAVSEGRANTDDAGKTLAAWTRFAQRVAVFMAAKKHDYVFVRDERPAGWNHEDPLKSAVSAPVFSHLVWDIFGKALSNALAKEGRSFSLAFRKTRKTDPKKPVPSFSADGRPEGTGIREREEIIEPE